MPVARLSALQLFVAPESAGRNRIEARPPRFDTVALVHLFQWSLSARTRGHALDRQLAGRARVGVTLA